MDKIHRVHKQEKTAYRKWISKKYYDRPDGQDISGKLSYTTKMAAAGGTLAGFIYTALPPYPSDSKIKLLRVARVLVPSIGMAFAFTCVTYYATNIRKKDDPFNYVLGGAAAGLIMGPATGMASVGAVAAVVFAALGYAKKSAHMHRQRLFPTIKQKEFSSYIKKHWDTSLIESAGKGNWIKEPPTN